MRCSIFYLAASAFAALAAASQPNPFNIPNNGYTFTVGQPTTLTWDPTTSGTVSLKLLWGAVTTADSGITIAQSIANSGTYTWTPSADLASQPDYTIEIIDDADPSEYNYLPRFVVQGATAGATTSTPSQTATITSSSSSVTPTTLSSSSSSSSSSIVVSTTSSNSTTVASTRPSASVTVSKSTSTSTATPPPFNAGAAVKVPVGLLALVMGAVVAF